MPIVEIRAAPGTVIQDGLEVRDEHGAACRVLGTHTVGATGVARVAAGYLLTMGVDLGEGDSASYALYLANLPELRVERREPVEIVAGRIEPGQTISISNTRVNPVLLDLTVENAHIQEQIQAGLDVGLSVRSRGVITNFGLAYGVPANLTESVIKPLDVFKKSVIARPPYKSRWEVIGGDADWI
jgi:hypothetical protein